MLESCIRSGNFAVVVVAEQVDDAPKKIPVVVVLPGCQMYPSSSDEIVVFVAVLMRCLVSKLVSSELEGRLALVIRF